MSIRTDVDDPYHLRHTLEHLESTIQSGEAAIRDIKAEDYVSAADNVNMVIDYIENA